MKKGHSQKKAALEIKVRQAKQCLGSMGCESLTTRLNLSFIHTHWDETFWAKAIHFGFKKGNTSSNVSLDGITHFSASSLYSYKSFNITKIYINF